MPIRVLLADDNLIVREGVRTLIATDGELDVVGTASDRDELVRAARELRPDVVVTDIRMPPHFEADGIEAAHEIRRAYPGTGVVILSQYDSPDYAIELLREGRDGYAYLLKDRVAEGGQLAAAIREVSLGRSWLDPRISSTLVSPIRDQAGLSEAEDRLLREVAGGRAIKEIAASRRVSPSAVSQEIDALFARLGRLAGTGTQSALRRLRMLHQAIVDREEVQRSLAGLVPPGVAERLRRDGAPGTPEEVEATVLISDVRGFCTIAETADAAVLASQLGRHRAAMSAAITAEGGTVLAYTGDGVMAVFGALVRQQDHADRAFAAARAMHDAQATINEIWRTEGLPSFPIGIGLSTGTLIAAILGSDEHLEYSLVGDCVNLTQRLQQFANGGDTILSERTHGAIGGSVDIETIGPTFVKGRKTPVVAYRVRSGVRHPRR